MSFMQPEVFTGLYFIVDLSDGSTDYFPVPAIGESLSSLGYTDSDDWRVEEGTLGRLSAPGYMDCTNWTPYESESEALAILREENEQCTECGSDLDFTEDDAGICPTCNESADGMDSCDLDELEAYIASCGYLGSLTRAVYCGDVLGEFAEEEDALCAIVDAMQRDSYWPTVYRISDHGNVIPVTDLPDSANLDPRCDHCDERHPHVEHEDDCSYWAGDDDGECICGDNVIGVSGYVSVSVDCIDAAS